MKHTLLASTALVALSTAASAEITISGTARIGMVTTEGAAKIDADSEFNMTTADQAFVQAVDGLTVYGLRNNDAAAAKAGTFSAVSTTLTTALVPTAAEMKAIGVLRELIAVQVTEGSGTTQRANAVVDLASIDGVISRTNATTNAAVAKASDTTVGKNRVRISFAGSGTTDGGLTYGFKARADESNSSSGTQYISGAFGKISMGNLDGGDEQMVGNLSGVGSSGAGFHQEFGYQSTDHNIGYSVSMAGVSFAATTDLVRGADPTKTGSNSAMGIKWAGDMAGASVGIGLGQSKIGTASERSMSASVGIGGLSIMAVSHTNDNGPAVAAITEAGSAATGTTHVAGVAKVDNLDTDTTGLSISYAMDAMSVTAFTRTESTSGVADKDYSGVGFTYNLGGATIKAGFVDANDISIMDFGVNFSF
jgi:outer membrane protein OmpU